MKWYFKVLKEYVTFTGRARRQEYWMFFLFNMIISYGLTFLEIYYLNSESFLISNLYSYAVLLPSIAVGVRRMHDVGKSGWYILIPIYNLVLACTDSEFGPNKWGDNPKGEGNGEEINQIGTE